MFFSFSGILFFLSGVSMSFFSRERYRKYRLDTQNIISYHYWMASLFIGLALYAYGLPSFFSDNGRVIAVGGMLATALNAFGFGHFFLVPIYSWFGKRLYIVARYLIYIFLLLEIAVIIIFPPHTALGMLNIIQWRIQAISSIPVLSLMVIAFALNIALLGTNFRRLKSISLFNVSAFIFTFFMTSLSGSYLYVGDDEVLLGMASFFLLFGISTSLFSSVWSALASSKEE